MSEQNLKFGEATEEQKETVLSKMREHGIMLPNIENWGYNKVVARVDELIAKKTGNSTDTTPDQSETTTTEENTAVIKENLTTEQTNEENETSEQIVENIVENPEGPTTEEPKKKYDGICHICRSAVYDGICSGCGFTLR